MIAQQSQSGYQSFSAYCLIAATKWFRVWYPHTNINIVWTNRKELIGALFNNFKDQVLILRKNPT